MAQTIFFRIGTHDIITLPTFISGLRNFLGILQNIDSALSENPQGSMRWELSVLQKNSPPLVGVTPSPRQLSAPDLSEAIQAQVFTNIHSLTISGERTQYMPDAALTKLKHIAREARHIGPSAVFVNPNGHEKQEEQITEATFKNVSELTDAKYTAYGSVVGKLESISVHEGNEFRVWDRRTGRPVRCMFPVDREAQVKDMLRETVMVAGVIKSNSAGIPLTLELEELERFGERALPTIEEMSGLVEDFTGGRTLKEYLEDVADE